MADPNCSVYMPRSALPATNWEGEAESYISAFFGRGKYFRDSWQNLLNFHIKRLSQDLLTFYKMVMVSCTRRTRKREGLRCGTTAGQGPLGSIYLPLLSSESLIFARSKR